MHRPFDRIPYLEGSRIIIRKIEKGDARALDDLRKDGEVYRYLPTFLYEQSAPDVDAVIRDMYGPVFTNRESILLGIYWKENQEFSGIAEFYGYRPEVQKISLGYRLRKAWWGRGIATETVKLMVDYLYRETDTQIITASSMVENQASASVLRKNGFDLVISGTTEDWGFERPVIVDKWIR